MSISKYIDKFEDLMFKCFPASLAVYVLFLTGLGEITGHFELSFILFFLPLLVFSLNDLYKND